MTCSIWATSAADVAQESVRCVYLEHDVIESLCTILHCLSDPGKASFADRSTQVIGWQQRVHDVQKLDGKVPTAGRPIC